jgi:antitoxin component YwqK of YwqJK toxin-antitoxin module
MKTTIKTEYYDNGQKREEGSYKNGKKDGLWNTWRTNSQIKVEVNYKDGKRDGFFTEYYDNGQKREEGSYKNGKVEGIWSHWYDNNQKKEEANYKDSKRDGLLILWNKNGQKVYEVNYRDGKVDGVWSHWHKNGQKEEVNYKDGKKDGLRTLWHKNGQKMYEGNYRYGKAEGIWSHWHKTGQKKVEVNYKDGKKDGLRTLWHKNRQKKEEVSYKVGNREGLFTEWYESGQKKLEGHYKDGKVDGPWDECYDNGQRRDEVHYIDMRKQSSIVSTWDEYLCVERVSQNTWNAKKEFELSIRSYEVLGEIFEFQDEEGNLSLPDEIEGRFVVGSSEEHIIGGNLISRSDEYGEVRFTDFQQKEVSDWLDFLNWNSNKIRKELKKLSKLEKGLQKTVERWSAYLTGRKTSSMWSNYGWNLARHPIAQYIFEYTSSHGGFPKGIHQIENLGGGAKTVNFDSVRQHFEDDPIEEFISIDSSSEIPSTSFEDNEIYYPATDYELESHEGHKNKEFVFRGSLMDGVEIDLLGLSGLELTDSDVDKIWGDINCSDLLAELDCVEIDLCEIDEDADEIPGQSDSFYEYQCGDKDQFARKLRAWIIKFLEDSP